jgi:hypothetical protein
LRVLHGRTPLIHLVRGPWSPDRPFDPAYSMALFDDGTLVYEGRRCVRLGGVVIARLGGKELAAVRALLDTACAGFDRATDGEVCADAPTLRLTCASEDAVLSGTDHCRGEDDQGVRLQALAAAFIDKTGASAWIGEPVERQACGRGDRDLAPRELAAAHDGWFTRAQVARSAIAHQP